MADTKLADLTSGTAEGTDIVYAVKDPSGTPLDRKVTLSSVKDYITAAANLFTTAQTIHPTSDVSALTIRRFDAGSTSNILAVQDQSNNLLASISSSGKITSNALSLSGNISAPAWTTSGIRYANVAATLTDTSSSGTVAAAYTNVYGGNTIAASNTVTFTDYYNTFIAAPVSGTNVTLTRPWALGLGGAAQIAGGTLNGTVLDISQAWSGTGTYTGIKYNVSNDGGPANAASLLMDLQLGGSSKFNVRKDGTIFLLGVQRLFPYAVGQLWWGNANRGSDFNTGAATVIFDITSSVSTVFADAFRLNALNGDVQLTRRGAANLRLGAADTTASSRTYTADSTTDVLTAASAHGLMTGAAISFTNSGGALPTGISSGTVYYAVVTGSTTIQIATSYANATAASPTVVNITADGSGTTTGVASSTQQSLSVQSFTGTNVSGSPLVINGSQGTGNAAGGDIIFRTAPAGTSGSTVNDLTNALIITNSNTTTTGRAINFLMNTVYTVDSALGNAISYFNNASGTRVQIGVQGNPSLLGLQLGAGGSVVWSDDTAPGANYNLQLRRRGAANLQLGAADAATPVAQTLSVQSVVAGTSNTAGTNFTITGSQGTGTGAGGSILFQIAPAGSSGTSQNALATFLETTSTRALNFYNTTDVTTNYERGFAKWSSNKFQIGTEKAGTGTARVLEFQTDGTTNLAMATNGTLTHTPNLSTANGITYYFTTGYQAFPSVRLGATWSGSNLQNGYISSGTGYGLTIAVDNATTVLDISTTGLIRLLGTTSSFPALKRSSTILQTRLADDSAYAPIEASTVRVATAYTVATLPAAGTAGRMAYVTDATAPTYLGTLTGGGTVVCPVFDNGTAWVSH